MTCERLVRLLALYLTLCAAAAAGDVRDFKQKASILLKEEPKNPKCFAETKKDFVCFWEEDEERAGSVDQYSFRYAYQNENGSTCALQVLRSAGGKRLFVCRLDRVQMFVQLDIRVYREGIQIHNRSLLIELLFLLDPPKNVTVSSTGRQGQLNVSWVAPSLKYMDDSMIYEVLYARADSHVGQVEAIQACSEMILRGLEASTKYRVQVRVNLDGITYDGFWSAWSDPVFIETLPAELDPLIVSLTFIVSFILVLLCLTMLLSHHRFLIKKLWPAVPTPDSKFQDLFTVYGGDFKEWLGQTSGSLWLTSSFILSEECPSPLEVLSELHLCPPLSSPPLPPKASKALTLVRNEDRVLSKGLLDGESVDRVDALQTNGWRTPLHDHWLLDRLREFQQHPVPRSQCSLLESQDTYITLSGNKRTEEAHTEDTLDEALPPGVFFASRKPPKSESHSDLGSVQQSSGSGNLSSQSSFEYPNNVWIAKDPGYTYMAVADSGVSMDYSPMSRADDIGKVVNYANDYKNEIPLHRRPFLVRQCPVHDDG
ncbi:erythropoietin receptor [Xiphophorus hellerii]|uniref:erythropoietin receptor n=1 Tax=Xiphophorus hellerii TaxID=8084 RepID=UPI0013B46B0A|nr:erythropoietin receptor-like [Xiphophorus hellerii]XP_032443493.1 erythropoietin receptor-like [Xiphophorus hellerii]XP_032443494.1 erythropoietin receptor-like [Xiphophorus hellerii]